MDHLLRNPQTMPASSIIPVLAYNDVENAIQWLCTVFGFSERWRAGNHRAQLGLGNGAVVVTGGAGQHDAGQTQSLMVRVENINSHYENTCRHNALILNPPAEFPYGEKQYTVQDPGGHIWMFTQSIADINVEDWGGQLPA